MSGDLKPFLMVIDDETGDFVDIKKIKAVVKDGNHTKIVLNNGTNITSPLRPREIWSRINVIRHKYGQRSPQSGKTAAPEESSPSGPLGEGSGVPSKK